MKITQLRNATLFITLGPHKIVVDPMLAPSGALPALCFFDGLRLRNPIVDLPDNTPELLRDATHCLITHCQKGHFDHLDRAGKAWLRERQIPVICTEHDASYLSSRGLHVLGLTGKLHEPQALLEGRVTTIRCTHGKGAVRYLMEHGVGYFIEYPDEPSLYLAGDTVLTESILRFVEHAQPDVCVIPAGGAHFDVGQELIMGADEAIRFARVAKGYVVANHLEALSHCPVSRAALRLAAVQAGVSARLLIPEDGECLHF